MIKELEKRIITSILLFLLTVFCIFTNFFIPAVMIVSLIVFIEISNIIYRINGNVNNWKNIVFNIIALFYIIFIFVPSAFGLHLAGPVFFLYILSVCICSDIGGYIIGKTIAGRKLIKISPNKTISGSVGSFCFSILPLLLFYNFNPSKYSYSINSFLLCLEISLVCQLGDLFISYLKRKAKVKDTGRILPGHGGVLDRIDGIIFAITFVFVYINSFGEYVDIWKHAFSKI
jgi:phosphatidate cytidylyltransferase